MKIVFISNYMNHHQYFLCKEIQKKCDSFCFVQTEAMTEERIKLGWQKFDDPMITDGIDTLPEILSDCDAVICGGISKKLLNTVKNSIPDSAITFIYSEPLFKNVNNKKPNILRRVKAYMKYCNLKNSYLLCAGAYVSYDYEICGLFKNRAFNWGYFPVFYDVAPRTIFAGDEIKLLWAGRFLDWKHPEDALTILKQLIDSGVQTSLIMIGSGPEEENVRNTIKQYGLEANVSLLGAKKSDAVRQYMQSVDVLLFTSDRGEGWGVIANEGINSRCLVVGCEETGSVPFIIGKDKGVSYKRSELDTLGQRIKELIDNPSKANEITDRAYNELEKNWTPAVAAERLLKLINCLKEGSDIPLFDGVCGKADTIEH